MLKVILIDDEERILNGLKKIIDWEANGFIVAGAFSDAQEALAAALEISPALIITDIEMPEFSGLDLIEILHHQLPDTFFVILSAHDQFHYAQRAICSGVFRYLLKPIDTDQLVHILDETRKCISSKSHESDKQSAEKKVRLLKMVFFHEEISGDYRQSEKEEAVLSSQLFSNYCFRLLFFHPHMIKDNQFRYLSCQEAVWDCAASFLNNVFKPVLVSRQGDCLILVIEHPFEEKCLENLPAGLEERIGIPSLVAISDPVMGLSDASRRFSSARAMFIRSVFFWDGLMSSQAMVLHYESLSALNDLSLLLSTSQKKLAKILTSSDFMMLPECCESIYHELSLFSKCCAPVEIHKFYQALLYNTIQECIPSHLQDPGLIDSAMIPRLKYLVDYHQYTCNWLKEKLCETMLSRGYGNDNIVNQVKLLIHEHYSESDLNLNIVTNQYHINYSYFSYLFKKKTGTNFSFYLSEVRISEAKNLLSHTSTPISEIAKKVGFQDSQNFFYVFKKICGESPKSYRLNASKGRENIEKI